MEISRLSFMEKCLNSVSIFNSYSNTNKDIQNFRLKGESFLSFPLYEFNFDLESDFRLFMEGNHKISFSAVYSKTRGLLNLLEVFKKFSIFTWENFLNIFEFNSTDKNSNHFNLKGILEENFNFLKMDSSPIYKEIMESCKDYEKKKGFTIRIKSHQKTQTSFDRIIS